MIIDLDSHLRDGYFLDEIYKLEGPYAKLTPVPIGNGQGHNKKFIHSLDPISPQGRAAHSHPYIYDPNYGWRRQAHENLRYALCVNAPFIVVIR